MRAVRYHGPYDVRLEHDVAEPVCQPHQIKIQPLFCGICGSDLHAYTTPETIPFKDTPHPLTGETWPLTLGHEFSGVVTEVGSQVTNRNLKVGDRVAVQPTICCHQCSPCAQGATNCCESFGFIGLTGWGGGLSDYVCVEEKFVFKLPDNISSEVGALIEPFAVSWHAVHTSGLTPSQTALVLGAGPIGLATIQALLAHAITTIIVVEKNPVRLRQASASGATAVLDASLPDLVAQVKALCGGQGPDLAFDCAGVAASITTACRAVRPRGRVVCVAVWEVAVAINLNGLVFGEKVVSGAVSYVEGDFENVIENLGRGAMSAEGMVSRVTTMEKVVEEGFEALLKNTEGHVKILVDCRAGA